MAVAALPAGVHDWRVAMALLIQLHGAPRDGPPSAMLADRGFAHPVVHGLVRYGRRRLVIGSLENKPPRPPVRTGINTGFRVIPER